MHGKSYKSRTEHSRKYGFGSNLRNPDFLIFSSNHMYGYHQVIVLQSGQRDQGLMYIDSCTNFSLLYLYQYIIDSLPGYYMTVRERTSRDGPRSRP